MTEMTIEQAIRNSIEAERAAARFYQLLAESTEDPEAKIFLEQMRDDEVQHARAIEAMAKEISNKDLPVRADGGCEKIETAPEWKYVDHIDYLSALRVALESERSAVLYYSAVAEAFTGKQKAFFEDLAATEETHAKRISEILARVEI
ncbi:MAG: ferritin family protein [Myxococcota bacterium]